MENRSHSVAFFTHPRPQSLGGVMGLSREDLAGCADNACRLQLL